MITRFQTQTSEVCWLTWMVAVLATLALAACPLLAQSPQPGTDDPTQTKDPGSVQSQAKDPTDPAQPKGKGKGAAKKPAAGSLEESLQLALQHNPEIRLKEHGVRTAELELSVMQQKVLGQIAVAHADHLAVWAISNECNKRLMKLLELRRTKGIVSDLDIGDAQVAVAKYTAEEVSKRAALEALTGKFTVGILNKDGQPFPGPLKKASDPTEAESQDTKKPGPDSLEKALQLGLKNNPELRLKAHAIRTAELELGVVQQQVLGRIAALHADILGSRAIHEETKKRLNKLLELHAKAKGLVSELEISDAEVAVAKYGADVASKEAELATLTGKSTLNIPKLENPPILKTYTVPDGNAEAMAKVLQEAFKQDSKLRITAVGKNQIMVYAPPGIQIDIAMQLEAARPQRTVIEQTFKVADADKIAILLKGLIKEAIKDDPPVVKIEPGKKNTIRVIGSPDQIALAKQLLKEAEKGAGLMVPDAEKFRKALQTPVEIAYKNWTMKAVVENLQNRLLKEGVKGVNLIIQPGGAVLGPKGIVQFPDQEVSITLAQPVTLAAALQLLEDQHNIRFVFRDYGIVGMHVDLVPRGALLVRDFVKEAPAK